MSDREIILGCLQNDLNSQKALFDKYANSMKALCLRYLNNEQDAEDVLQDGFIIVFTKLKDFKFSGSLKNWIGRIMVNLSLQTIKKNKKLRFDEIDSKFDSIKSEPGIVSKLEEKDLMNLLAKLPVGYRTVFNLFVIEGYSHREIGKMLKIGESTSRSQLTKAKIKLKELIREYYR